MQVRKARLQDASLIFELVNSLSSDGTLLRRAFAEICENIRDFTVAESDAGNFLGCGALHLYGPHLAEVRSIVVRPEAKGTRRRRQSAAISAGRSRRPRRRLRLPLHNAFRTSSFTTVFVSSKTAPPFQTRSIRTAKAARVFIDAMKSPWLAVNCPRVSILGTRQAAEQLVKPRRVKGFAAIYNHSCMQSAATMNWQIILALVSCAVLGLRHGFDYDHLAAISDITAVQRTWREGMRLGLTYALGHAFTVVALGAAVVMLHLPLASAA